MVGIRETALRLSSQVYSHIKPKINIIWTSDNAAAIGRLNKCTAWRYISTSTVARRGPPKMSTTPKLVKQNTNISSDAAKTAGISSGRVTLKNTWRREAPSMRAASFTSRGRRAQKPPTSRTITV